MGTQLRLTAEIVKGLPADGRDRIVFDDLVKGFGVRVTATGTKIFIAQRRVGGKSLRLSIGKFPETSVLKAREEARTLLSSMATGEDPRKTKVEVPSDALAPMLFSEAVDNWLQNHVRVKLKPLTVRDYEKISTDLKARFEGRPLSTITKDDARSLHASMSKTPRRANYYLAVLNAICSFNDHPPVATKVKRYREGKRERIMTAKELEAAFAAIQTAEAEKKLSVWACGALRFALLTGARPAEIKAIEWRHLDHDRQRVVLEDSKANRQRIIYTNAAAWTVLTSVPRFGKFVFAGSEKNTAYARIANGWLVVRKLAGLPDVRLYDARHTFASEAAMAGHNLPMIGTLLGHTVPATTQRYVHLVDDPASKASQDVGDRMAAAMAGAAKSAGATPLKRRKNG